MNRKQIERLNAEIGRETMRNVIKMRLIYKTNKNRLKNSKQKRKIQTL